MADRTPRMSCLHRIGHLPIDFRAPVFAHYPRAKLGVRESVLHYARKLEPLAREILAAAAQTRWALTAPALINIPAAANLICRQLYGLLLEDLPARIDLTLVEIRARRHGPQKTQSRHRMEYSRMDASQRRLIREAESRTLIPDPGFRQRSVIYVNDINITGTQQEFMQGYFRSVAPEAVHWLYLLDVEPAIGRSEPAIEARINRSSHASFEQFADLLCTQEVDYTGKCLARLFGYSSECLQSLFSRLDGERLRRIRDLTAQEGAFGTADFGARLALLERHCAGRAVAP